MNKHSHLTLDNRMKIQMLLDQMESFRHIARELCKDPTSIPRKSDVTSSSRGTAIITKHSMTVLTGWDASHNTFAVTDDELFTASTAMHIAMDSLSCLSG